MGHKPMAARRLWRRALLGIVLLVLLVFLCATPSYSVWATPNQNRLRQSVPTRVPTPIPSWVWVGFPGGDPRDYAPSGVPDLDQRQGTWGLSGEQQAGKNDSTQLWWTHCGPVAAADALWWLDSRLEPGRTPPPYISDGYSLVTKYGDWDDHAANNVAPLVEDLARRLDTDGLLSGNPHQGTDPTTVVPALRDYLTQKGLGSALGITLVRAPTFERLLASARNGDGVILYLGLWQEQRQGWIYFGGHYVALGGVEPLNRLLAICDPLRDAFEASATPSGRSGAPHSSHDEAHDVHNDVRYLSQDGYAVGPPDRPEGAFVLEDYGLEDASPFLGQNMAPELMPFGGEYGGGPAQAELNYAWIVSRYRLHLPITLRRAT